MANCSFGFLAIALALVVCFVASSEAIRVDRNVANTWCVALPGASEAALQKDIDEICGLVDCSPIKPGGVCFDPETVTDHASFALNLYYKQQQSQQSACNWGGTGLLIVTDPSYANCHYP